ncbi:hypothetical protein [Pontibacter beigongshangensis]|uniref:hypothetical protein n=1 Tax=Pontibacter beigongshangensis TaxID=2574733 RepID=UPI00164F7110|nr:hypothetical protein [Pontibacter beigongshangensis]
MAENKDKSNELKSQDSSSGGVSGRPPHDQTGPVAGGADNTRGENKPSREGTSGGAKAGKESPDKGPNANSTTTTRGADSTDKEFRNDQPNASTLKGHKSNENLGNEKG